MEPALGDLRVLDLTRLLPGPYCTQMLSDLGADVLKIEDTGSGDYARFIPPLVDETAAFFWAVNRNKRSMKLNLKAAEGVEIFGRLVERADVLVEGFRPGVTDKLGIGYEALGKINPRLIYCSISGYGREGPYRDRAGHDLNYNSLAGVIGITGSPDGRPCIPGVQMADLPGALYASFAILAALHQRERTGNGQHLDVSLCDASFSLLSPHLATYAAEGGDPPGPAQMRLTGKFVCYNVYRTGDDRYMSLGALEPKFWTAFCRAVEKDHLADNAFDEAADGESTYEEIKEVFAGKTQKEWMDFLKDVEACCEPVLDFQGVIDHPHFKQRDILFQLPVSAGHDVLSVGLPVKFSRSPSVSRNPAPRMGEHTDQVLTDLGYSNKEIEDLRKRGVI